MPHRTSCGNPGGLDVLRFHAAHAIASSLSCFFSGLTTHVLVRLGVRGP
jgi:hypothetical protein